MRPSGSSREAMSALEERTQARGQCPRGEMRSVSRGKKALMRDVDVTNVGKFRTGGEKKGTLLLLTPQQVEPRAMSKLKNRKAGVNSNRRSCSRLKKAGRRSQRRRKR